MKAMARWRRCSYVLLVFIGWCIPVVPVAAQEKSSAAISPVASTTVVIKSENDTRDYRYLILKNKLRVLLISDPATEKAAAALAVHIGHNQDPEDRAGLAHFLEHMLFLGTEKYPDPGEYQAFINQYGGSNNAYTAAEYTNFFFDIDSAQLEPALDRFAQFFIAPLFNETSVDHERNTVNAEYLSGFMDDSRRVLDVYRELLNPQHPAVGFPIGNLESLADRENQPVRNDLVAFYQRYYSSQLMTLVVLGRESLDDLEKLVATRFVKIPDHNVPLAEKYPQLFPADFLPVNVSIKPEKELRQLSLLFPVAEFKYDYQKKPWNYIANLLGHEGQGSVLSLLKSLGWAESLSAGLSEESRHDAFFQITVNLTEKGIRAREQIAPLLFYVIEQLKSRGLKDWRYEELKELGDINFRFHEKKLPLDSVSQLAYKMHLYAPEDILRGEYLYMQYDEDLIKSCLAHLRAENALRVFIFPEVETDQISEFYQTPYHVEKTKLESYEVKPAIRKKLFFPAPNAFIPKRLAVKSDLILPTPLEGPSHGITDWPQRIVRNDRIYAWFQQDKQFHLPKASIKLRLKLPLVAANADGAAQAQLFAALVMDELNEYSYPASLAGLDYSVRANSRGLDIDISGYNSRQGLLLSKIAKSIHTGRFSQERFGDVKQEILRRWRNENKNAPYKVLARQVPVLQYAPYWSNEELINSLSNKSQEDFQRFATRILRDGTMEVLIYGNLFRQEAIKLVALAEYELLGNSTGQKLTEAQVFLLSGQQEKPWLYRHSLEHSDNVMQLYVQGLQPDVKDAAHMKLLQQILQPAFFDQLRTEKQLGYVVSVFPLPLRDLEGTVFVIQSPTADEAQLLQEIDLFLDSFAPSLTAKFAENKLALVRQLNEPATSLTEQAERYWESILLGDLDFNRREQLAAAVAAITPESLEAYYRAVMRQKNRRLWLSSQKMPPEKSFMPVEDINRYQAQQKSIIYP